jgi:hypothetical protein
MPYYRFYFLTSANRIGRPSHDVDCVDDEDADKTALRLLGDQRKYDAIEVWNAVRLVSRLDSRRRLSNHGTLPVRPAQE